MKPIHTIDDVIAILQDIIDTSIQEKNPLGYFAALYQKVTIKVKEGIHNGFFEDGPRMEKLDIIFAKRYIDAYYSFTQNKVVTQSWEKAFLLSKKFWPIVLQHLLIGMNAHINLDLGIAAAEVSKGAPIENLKGDFDKINSVLSSLVLDVENDLAKIYPFLRKILKYTRDVDNFLVDFSMEIARNGAWDFAVQLSNSQENNVNEVINERDISVAKTATLISKPGIIANIIFGIIRLGEKGSVSKKIKDLMD
ncbi:hypothetical protein EV195_101564 [Tenacibaculum skagerrakense]|uniref:Uncharacterized protein n=1 Tax=Tenacibaculum skagerrakense TaxID=186571 RepID=A0A4R2P2N1_9FLAO|nr:DUF5995 family protein [Tenacibaculum skagerrakense]TCP28388.1 hypothetical protein EV195_101564 [Tenacibaculum skagerrakense]